MRSFSDQIRFTVPATVAVVFTLVSALPISLFGFSLTPHVVWLMTLAIGVAYPAAWPPLLAFALGLLSDFIMATPLGAQALLTLLLILSLQRQARRLQHQLFRALWLEAAGALLVLFVALWAVTGWVDGAYPPIEHVLIAAGVSALWYPLFFVITRGLVKLLPGAN